MIKQTLMIEQNLVESHLNHLFYRLQLNANDRLEKLCRRMSVRLLKPPAHIHIFLDGKELR